MLTADQFRKYPPQARELAIARLALLQQLPLAFLPLLLRELIAYDWKFPAERRELDKQFTYLAALPPDQLRLSMVPFEELRLDPALNKLDWVNSPAQFSEQLTAHLWASHQIDAFRAAAVDYVQRFNTAVPDPPLATPRLTIVVAGQGVTASLFPVFRKLRPHGVYYSHVDAENGVHTILNSLALRAAAHPSRYGHWYVDGAARVASPQNVISVSYDGLSAVRSGLATRIKAAMESGKFDPEALRTMLAQARPEGPTTGDPVLDRFNLSLFTEGSGTQVFSTTFVQWAAREVLRRAQPLTLLARFTPRQRERPMNEMLSPTAAPLTLDAEGSLMDADMGAYYTWLNQQRLPGAEGASFFVWFENHNDAVAIGPAFKPGAVSTERLTIAALLNRALD